MAIHPSRPSLFYVTRDSAGKPIDCGFTDGEGLLALTLIAHLAGCKVSCVPTNTTRH